MTSNTKFDTKSNIKFNNKSYNTSNNKQNNKQNNNPIIRILFYAPGTGFSTQIENIPFTIAYKSAGDAEVKKDKNNKAEFDIDNFFTQRDNIKDNREIPGYIVLVEKESDIKDPNTEQVFNVDTGGTAGHMYQRLIEYNILVKDKNNDELPMYSIYTVIDSPDSSMNLDYLLKRMTENGYPDDFFDVCITASKGIDQLLTCVNKYNLDTNLVLINGASTGYLHVNLVSGSNVRAIILTHGGKDTSIINKQKLKEFINDNPTKIFIYANKYDGHIPASLILGDTNSLHKSLASRQKVHRNFRYSFLPILINSVYYVGRHNSDWKYLIDFMSKDKEFIDTDVNINLELMKGGGNFGKMNRFANNGRQYEKHSEKSYCGCSGSLPLPEPNPTPSIPITINNNNVDSQMDKNYLNMSKLYCDCDRRNDDEYNQYGGKQHKTKSINDDSINEASINEENIIDHLYPKTSDSPFSDVSNSEPDVAVPIAQGGGSNIDEYNEYNKHNEHNDENYNSIDMIGQSIIGKSLLELRYMSARNDYLMIRNK